MENQGFCPSNPWMRLVWKSDTLPLLCVKEGKDERETEMTSSIIPQISWIMHVAFHESVACYYYHNSTLHIWMRVCICLWSDLFLKGEMSGASESLNRVGGVANTEKECQDYLSCLPVEVHILSGGRLPLVPMKVGWEELQREVGAGRHKSLLEGNQYKQDKKARPEHKLCSPSFLFSHQRGEENAWSQGQRSKHQEKKGRRGWRVKRKKKKNQVIIFSIWGIELHTSDSILPTLIAGKLVCTKTEFERRQNAGVKEWQRDNREREEYKINNCFKCSPSLTLIAAGLL